MTSLEAHPDPRDPPHMDPGVLEPRLLRCLGAIDYVAGWESQTRQPCVAVVAASGAESASAVSLLERISAAHARIEHPLVPKLLGRGPGGGVLLACDAAMDLEALAAIAAEVAYPIHPDSGPAFAVACLEMLDAVHRQTAAEPDGPLCYGAFSAGNVLVSASGEYRFLGWGHPAAGPERTRLLAKVSATFAAPEIAFRAAPTPGGDLTGAALFFHSFLGLGSLPPPVVSGLRGESMPGFESLPGKIAELMANSHAVRPEERSIPRFLQTLREIFSLIGITPNVTLFQRDLAGLVRALEDRRSAPNLEVADDGAWFQVQGGERVPLERRGPLRRLLRALARQRLDQPGAALSWETLLREGWPGQRPTPESGRNRVYVAVASLRRMGLRDALVTRDDGYLIDPALRTVIAAGERPAS